MGQEDLEKASEGNFTAMDAMDVPTNVRTDVPTDLQKLQNRTFISYYEASVIERLIVDSFSFCFCFWFYLPEIPIMLFLLLLFYRCFAHRPS